MTYSLLSGAGWVGVGDSTVVLATSSQHFTAVLCTFLPLFLLFWPGGGFFAAVIEISLSSVRLLICQRGFKVPPAAYWSHCPTLSPLHQLSCIIDYVWDRILSLDVWKQFLVSPLLPLSPNSEHNFKGSFVPSIFILPEQPAEEREIPRPLII